MTRNFWAAEAFRTPESGKLSGRFLEHLEVKILKIENEKFGKIKFTKIKNLFSFSPFKNDFATTQDSGLAEFRWPEPTKRRQSAERRPVW